MNLTPKAMLGAVVRGYRYFLSPLLPPACRFYPSCSDYAEQALHVHGALRGGWLAAKRLCRCGPWHPGGFDPVPRARAGYPAASSAPQQGRR
jgi:putative membrane protein insertion efficiency factor